MEQLKNDPSKFVAALRTLKPVDADGMETIRTARRAKLKEMEDEKSRTFDSSMSEEDVHAKFMTMVAKSRRSQDNFEDLLKEFPELEKEIETLQMFKRICEMDWSKEKAYEAFAHIKVK